MKKLKLVILMSGILLLSCKQQKNSVSEKVAIEDSIEIVKVTRQNSIPGISDGQDRYTQQWMIQIKKPDKLSANISLLLEDRKIEIGNLQDKGIVFGSDNDDLLLRVRVNYPLDTSYPISDYKSSNIPRLLIENKDVKQVIVLDNIVILKDLIYPSTSN